jgi:hypothetical protein
MQRYTVYLYLETALHVSGGTSAHHQERIQLYLQHLVFVTQLLLSAAIVEKLELVWVCCGWRTPLKMELIWYWILLSGDVHLRLSVHRNWNIVMLTDIGTWKILLLWQRYHFCLHVQSPSKLSVWQCLLKNIEYKCTWIAFLVFQDAICLIVSLPISWGLSIFMNVSKEAHCAVDNWIYSV